MVGGVMLHVLEERMGAQVGTLLPVASERSAGKVVRFKGQEVPVLGLEEALRQRPDLALFSAGGETSLAWAPQFAAAGTLVVDNSSAWRMDPDKMLIVPEINGHLLDKADLAGGGILANPNCSTIQLVLCLGSAACGIWCTARGGIHLPERYGHGHEGRTTDGG
jgi:aspartate-semialdehyde dehydrogenase